MAKKNRKSVAERALELTESEHGLDELPVHIYTARRQRKKLMLWRLLAAILTIALLVFICLYVLAKMEFETRAKESFVASVDNAVLLIDECAESDFDYDRRYREICAELNSARQMLFWTSEDRDRKICMNELYFAFLRMPNQARLYLSDISDGLSALSEGKTESGYSILQNILSRMDKQDVLTQSA